MSILQRFSASCSRDRPIGVRHAVPRLLGALGLFLLLAVVKTYPLALHLRTHLTTPGDPYHITWILAWDTHALTTRPLQLFEANTFYPAERALAFSEHLLGALPIYAPVYLFTGNPVAAYNTLFILSFALSALSMYCLAHYWTGAFWPSLVAGGLFGFAPYRFGQHGHLHLLCLFWAPLALLFLDRFLRTGRWRDLAATSAFFWLQVLSSLSLGAMMVVAVALYVGHYAVAVEHAVPPRRLLFRGAAFAGPSLALFAVLHLPYVEVQRSWGFDRSLEAVMLYAPDILNYLSAPPFMSDLYLAVFRPLPAEPAPEKWLFPGLVLPLLALLGSWGAVDGITAARARTSRQVWWLLLGAAVILSLGPFLVAFGRTSRIPLPYLVLYNWLPGFSAMRVPGRFVLLAVLAASVLAAMGAARCAAVAAGRWPREARLAPAATALALLGLAMLEQGDKTLPGVQVPTDSAVPPVYRWLASARPGPIVEIPFGLGPSEDPLYVYLSTVHWLPLVNGLSSYFPSSYAEIKAGLASLPDPDGVQYASALGIKAIVVHTGQLSPADATRWLAAGDRELRVAAAFGRDVVYLVPPPRLSPSIVGEVLPPSWLPVEERRTIPVRFRSAASLPWRHPSPYGESSILVRWEDPATGTSVNGKTRARLPLVVPAGETVTVPVALRPPANPGRYSLQLSMSSPGVAFEPRTVEIRQADLPSSREAAHLGATLDVRTDGSPPLTVPASAPIRLDVTAVNAGRGVWLARTGDGRGAVGLGWRWLRGGREVPGLQGRVPIAYDVFAGQRYEFRAAVPAPPVPGAYALEVGVVSERVAWMPEPDGRRSHIAVEVGSGG